LLRWLAPRPEERILDIGCGDGYYDALIAESGAYVVGIDVHPERLRIAGSRNHNDRTEYHFVDAERMGGDFSFFRRTASQTRSFARLNVSATRNVTGSITITASRPSAPNSRRQVSS